MQTDTTVNDAADQPRSRRALLAGIVGGLGAWLVAAAERAMPAEAATGDAVRIGQVVGGGVSTTGLRAQTPNHAFRVVQMGRGTGIHGEATSGRAVVGKAGSQGTGVWGSSTNHIGVFGTSGTGIAVNGRATGLNSVALFGDARGRDALALVAFGPSHIDGDLTVVGRLIVTDPMTIGQTSTPRAPDAGQVRLFAKEDRWGKTQVCVQFASGAVQTLATEP